MRFIYFVTLTFLFAYQPSLAQQESGNESSSRTEPGASQNTKRQNNVDLYLGLGVDFGGDKIADVQFMDGSSESLEAGEGTSYVLGLDLELGTDYMIRGAFGKKNGTVDATNGDIEFDRTLMELTGYRFWGHHGIGGGLTNHSSGEVSCDISNVCSGSVDIKDQRGVIVEYLYRHRALESAGFTFGIRASSGLDYEADVNNSSSVDGNFYGLTLGLKF